MECQAKELEVVVVKVVKEVEKIVDHMEVHVKPVIMLNKKQVHTDRSKQISNQFDLNINKNLHKLLNKNLMNYWQV